MGEVPSGRQMGGVEGQNGGSMVVVMGFVIGWNVGPMVMGGGMVTVGGKGFKLLTGHSPFMMDNCAKYGQYSNFVQKSPNNILISNTPRMKKYSEYESIYRFRVQNSN